MSALAILSPKSRPLRSLDGALSSASETEPRRVSWHQWGGLLNDRRAHRIAFPETLHVVGMAESDSGQLVRAADPIIARGRDISVDGISFKHDEPLPHRYVAVSYRSALGTETMIAKLSWCRFAREDRYVSGGRLTEVPQLNPELNIDWDSLQQA